MEIILSAAMSIDGYIDDCSEHRLILSSAEDWEAVYRLRAECDAVVIGAGTVRKDDPALRIKDKRTQRSRLSAGLAADLDKVIISSSLRLDPMARIFNEGTGRRIIITDNPEYTSSALNDVAQLMYLEEITAAAMGKLLENAGYTKVLVEGGEHVLTMFLSQGVVDTLRVAVAPFFVGESNAPRLVSPAKFPWNAARRMNLAKVEKIGDMAVLEFRL